MYNYIIIGSVVVICVCSIVLILQKLKNKKVDLSAVPISDIKEIQTLKNAYPAQPRMERSLMSSPIEMPNDLSSALSLEVEEKEHEQEEFDKLKKGLREERILKENHQKEVEHLQNELTVLKEIFKKESKYFIEKIEGLEKDKQELKETLFKEVSLREETSDVPQEKGSDEDKSFAVQNATAKGLHSTNQRLLERIQNQKDSVRQMKDQIKKIKSQSYEIQNEDRYKIEELESKLSDVMYEKEKLEKEYQDIEKLTTYNLKLRMKVLAYNRALFAQNSLLLGYQQNNKTKELQMKSIISELKMENSNLIGKVKESVASVGNLKRQIAETKEEMQQRMHQLMQGLGTVSVSAEELAAVKALNEKLIRAVKNAEVKIQALTEERKQILSDISRNEFNYNKLKEFNAHILDKEKMLQYELTKSRAKILGLEKICEDFKVQIEKSDKAANRIGRIRAAS